MSESARFLERLDAVCARLRAQSMREIAPNALTAPDPSTGEQWQAGQVWAHLAEFIPYWIGEARTVIAAAAARQFGRTKTDAGRVAAIERDRHAGRAVLWARVDRDLSTLREFLDSLDDAAWRAEGVHPTLGAMAMPRIVDEFLIGHLEQHADQLDALASTPVDPD